MAIRQDISFEEGMYFASRVTLGLILISESFPFTFVITISCRPGSVSVSGIYDIIYLVW